MGAKTLVNQRIIAAGGKQPEGEQRAEAKWDESSNSLKETFRKIGRPPVITLAAIKKMEDAFTYGASIIEACANADVSQNAFYLWLEDNGAYRERILELRQKVDLAARKCVIDAIRKDPAFATKYLADRRKREWGKMESANTNKGDAAAVGAAIGAATSIVFGSGPSPFMAGANATPEQVAAAEALEEDGMREVDIPAHAPKLARAKNKSFAKHTHRKPAPLRKVKKR